LKLSNLKIILLQESKTSYTILKISGIKYFFEIITKEEESVMKTFILFTKLSPDLSKQMKNRKKLGRDWLEQVKKKCPEVKFIEHFALLGKYDFLDIYEAPDEETAAKVSMISLTNGAFLAESLTAIPYKKFLKLTQEI
jgi:uncharacterized protein with GYD domain